MSDNSLHCYVYDIAVDFLKFPSWKNNQPYANFLQGKAKEMLILSVLVSKIDFEVQFPLFRSKSLLACAIIIACCCHVWPFTSSSSSLLWAFGHLLIYHFILVFSVQFRPASAFQSSFYLFPMMQRLPKHIAASSHYSDKHPFDEIIFQDENDVARHWLVDEPNCQRIGAWEIFARAIQYHSSHQPVTRSLTLVQCSLDWII